MDAQSLGEAWKDASTARNITAELKKAGFFHFNLDVFTRLDVAPSSVTDRPAPQVVDATAVLGSHDVSDNDQFPCHADVTDNHDHLTDEPTQSFQPDTNGLSPDHPDQLPQEGDQQTDPQTDHPDQLPQEGDQQTDPQPATGLQDRQCERGRPLHHPCCCSLFSKCRDEYYTQPAVRCTREPAV